MAQSARNLLMGRRRGSSLVELALVVAIISILAAIASPRYGQAVANYRLRTVARRIVEDLKLARERARARGARQTVVFSPSANTYRIPSMPSPDGSPGGYTVDLSDASGGATLVSADFSGDSAVVFDGYGVPDSGGVVVVRIGDMLTTVVLDPEIGRATLQ